MECTYDSVSCYSVVGEILFVSSNFVKAVMGWRTGLTLGERWLRGKRSEEGGDDAGAGGGEGERE